MPEAQEYPYSFQSLVAIVVARRVVKVEPFWNEKFSKRLPYGYEQIEDLVEKVYSKYLRLHKSEFKNEQKENKILTVKVDINKGKVTGSANKNPLQQR